MQIDFYAKNILVVDDNRVNIVILQSLLEDEGYTSIFSATSAVEAYEILKYNNIDMILLDVMMPQIDGLEACKTIRQSPNCNKIPIIMITADNSDETLEKSFEAGANDFVTKPVNITNLKVRIESQFMNAHKDALILNQNRLLTVNETVQMLAHQWRQPLSVINIIAMDIAIENELGKITTESLDKSLTKINGAVIELSNTLDEFRQISHIEKETSLNNINNSIEKSLQLIQDRFKSNNIILQTDFKEQKDIFYFQNELIKILINIYTNSIEAFKKNPAKKEKLTKISTKQTDLFTYITIVDNAGGIEKSLLPRIFEPYVSTKEEQNSVGLGLYNAFNILKESMNGTIEISSEDEETTVTIKLQNKYEKEKI
ncbi:response regulator [Sulfurimonas sp.]|uniref:response regulator n=1 Tax=Sulfurimonas sp. TaxID=2022749 RepID=UPI0035678AE0